MELGKTTKKINTLVQLCIARHGLPTILDVIFVVRRRIFTKRGPIHAILDHLTRKLQGDGL